MKRLIISGLLLIIMVGFGIGTLVYIDRSCSQTIDQAELAKQAIDRQDYQPAAEEIGVMETDWNEKEPYLCLFVRQGELEEISRQMASLSDLLAHRDFSEASASLNRIISIADHIKTTEKPFPLYIF